MSTVETLLEAHTYVRVGGAAPHCECGQSYPYGPGGIPTPTEWHRAHVAAEIERIVADRVREAAAKVVVVSAQLESERVWLLEWIDGQLEALPKERTPTAHGKLQVPRDLLAALGDPQ